MPTAAQAAFLAAAARACGDSETATELEQWLDEHFSRLERKRLWLNTNPEWRIGVSANRFIALAQENGSDLRALIRRPLPRDYFTGPLLDRTIPDDLPVFQAFRDKNDALVLEFDGGGAPVELFLRNIPANAEIVTQGAAQHFFDPENNIVSMPEAYRATITVHQK